MRILIDSGSYHCLNVGDVAMLKAAVERLRGLWPHASLAAVTNAPETLRLHCPGVLAVPLAGRVALLTDRFLGRVSSVLPRRLRNLLDDVEERMRVDQPRRLASIVAGKRALALRRDFLAPRQYVDALLGANLVVASGAGVFTDAFVDNAVGVLATLDFAQRLDVPTALMGHGIGPVSNAILRQSMADVLPRAALIALRERRRSLQLLQSIGVSRDRIAVTGDDAIEMAHRCTPAHLGNAIGVNVRVARYAGVADDAVHLLRPAVQRAATRFEAPLVALPIAHHPDCHDGVAIREVMAGAIDARTPIADLKTPASAIDEVSRCRVVVTGSYHAAVFALAQGIPVVGLAATSYYQDKFDGLAELFGDGCEIVRMDDPHAGARLDYAIESAWTHAPRLREPLLRAAAAQVEQGRAAYTRLATLGAGLPQPSSTAGGRPALGADDDSAPASTRQGSFQAR
jgi:polysaccharide pyruvyl transferase WcaK-like protein